jgi:hypothetical protein
LDLYYSVSRVLLRPLGGVIFIIFGLFFTLFYPLSLSGPGMYFQTGQVFLSLNGQRGSLLVLLASFCVWTKKLICKEVVNRGSTIQSDVRRFCLQVRKIQVPCQPSGRSSHPVRTPICSCSIRPDDMPYRPDARHNSIIRLDDVFIPSGPYTVSRSLCASLHPPGRLSSLSGRPSVIDSFRFFPSS